MEMIDSQFVGREPSGRGFNAYKLNHAGLPYNPSNLHVSIQLTPQSVINSGCLATTSLLYQGLDISEVCGFELGSSFRNFKSMQTLGPALPTGKLVRFNV